MQHCIFFQFVDSFEVLVRYQICTSYINKSSPLCHIIRLLAFVDSFKTPPNVSEEIPYATLQFFLVFRLV